MVRLAVRAKPRAKTSRVLRAEGLRAEVSLAAVPVEGAANEELLRVLAEALDIPRNKVVEVTGLEEVEVVRRLAVAARG